MEQVELSPELPAFAPDLERSRGSVELGGNVQEQPSADEGEALEQSAELQSAT